jgi:hypothetical protein
VILHSPDAEFDSDYSASGHTSTASEHALRAVPLRTFYSVRSELQPVEQRD